jgi:DNA-binding beta-propeller fold protein YncE
MRPVTALLILALVAGCSDRQRLNPLDPRNPATHGSPTGFAALAGDGFAILAWDPVASPDVDGFRLYRRAAPDTQFVALGGLLPTSVTQIQDLALANGVDHAYRLCYVVGDRQSPPAEDTATPGPARPWVTDYIAKSLLRLTPDGRHVAERSAGSLDGPTALDVDPGTGRVWVCDDARARVDLYDPATRSYLRIADGFRPVAVAVDRTSGHAWICDEDDGIVSRYNPSAPGVPVVNAAGLSHPISVAVDQGDGSIWVCERAADRVRHIAFDGTPLSAAGVSSPSRVAVNSVTHGVWVTSFTARQVVELSSAGQPRDTLGGFGGPIGVALDGGGRVWIADAAASQVVVLDPLGQVAFRVPGMSQAHAVAVDPVSGEAWVTLPEVGAVALIDGSGRVMRRITGLGQPYEVAVNRPR